MNLRRLIALVFLLLAGCAVAAPGAVAPGALLAVGGGGTPDAIAVRALALAGGPQARLLIVPQASERAEAGDESLAFWRAHGATDARALDLSDPVRAREEIAAAELIWISGGDQNRLMTLLREAGLVEAIRTRWRAGTVVGGTSAGAAVLSGAMIVGGESADLASVRAGGTELAEGLGLWSGVIVDQHFLARQRFNRLLAAVLDRPELVGIGVDERTAVLVHADGRCEILGEGGVIVVDARRAAVLTPAAGAAHSASGVALAIHRDGDSFRLDSTGNAPEQDDP